VTIFIFILFSWFSVATTFVVQSVEDQLRESDAILEGHFLSQEGVELEDGSVATQMIFKVKNEYGINIQSGEFDEIIIHFPGGQTNQKRVLVHGVPEFVVGERVVILAKNHAGRLWGQNLGLGSFKVVNFNSQPTLINSIFPSDKRVSQFTLEEFESKVKQIKHSNLKTVKMLDTIVQPSKRAPASTSKSKIRSIAATSNQGENEEEQSNLGIFWLIALFAFAGGINKLMKTRRAH